MTAVLVDNNDDDDDDVGGGGGDVDGDYVYDSERAYLM